MDFDLDRFVRAQEPIMSQVQNELRQGRKVTHWMWFVFPQIDGLGSSETARRYAITSLDEARAYLQHPVLGARLLECTQSVAALQGRTAHQIFGFPDDRKFCSSMTLFELIAGADSAFSTALDKYYAGRRDPATLKLLQSASEK